MKKLISILGAIGIVASSATTVVACGGQNDQDNGSSWDFNNINNEDDALNQLDASTKNVYTATSDITKSLLAAKSENLGINNVDPLSASGGAASTTLNTLARFQGAADYSMNESQQTLRERMTNHTYNWKSTFGEKMNDKMSRDDKNYVAASATDFIKEGSLSTSNDSIQDDSLTYLLSGKTRATQISGSDENYYTQTNSSSKGSIISTIKTNVAAASGSNELTNLMNEFKPSKLSVLIPVLNMFVPMGATQAQPQEDTAGQLNTSPGNLKNIFFAAYKGSSFSLATKIARDSEQTTGFFPVLLEKIYIAYMNQIETLENNNSIDKNLLKALVGDNREKYLIQDVYNKSTVNCDEGADETPGNDFRENGNKWLTPVNNAGMFGKVITDMGNLKFHTKANKEKDKANLDSSKYLSVNADNESFDTHSFEFIDKDVQTLLEDTSRLFEMSNAVIPEDVMKEAIASAIPTIPLMVRNIIKGIGIDLTNEDLSSIFIKLMLEIDKIMVGSNGKSLEFGSTDEEYNKISYDHNLSVFLSSATSLISKTSTNWDDKSNTEYVNKVYEILGKKDESKWEADSFGDKLSGLMKKLYEDTSKLLNSTISENWLFDNVDTNIIDPKVWIPNSIKTEKSNGVINKITYSIEYKGLGNTDVTNYKISDEALKYSQQDIYNNLTSDDSSAFKDKYLGTATWDQLHNVDHRYTIVWENVSDDVNEDEFKLAAITKTEAHINGEWVDMQI